MSVRRALAWCVIGSYAVVSGCNGCCTCNSGFVAESSPQGQQLSAILLEQRKIELTTPEPLPIQFNPVEIEKQVGKKGNSYRAVLIWRLPEGKGPDDPDLLRVVDDLTPAPELPQRSVEVLQLALQYQGNQNEPVGTESINVDVAKKSGKIILFNLGKAGAPFSITGRPTSATIQEQGTIPITSPADLAIHFAPVRIIKRATTAQVAKYSAVVSWNLTVEPKTVREELAKSFAEKAPGLKENEIRSVLIELNYRDKDGESIARERIALSLQPNRGSVTLKRASTKPFPESVDAMVVGIKLKDREILK